MGRDKQTVRPVPGSFLHPTVPGSLSAPHGARIPLHPTVPGSLHPTVPRILCAPHGAPDPPCTPGQVTLSRTLISGDTDIPGRMLIFCHLCIGSILGLHLARVMGNHRMLALATLGSIIPDLVDKPLGYLVYGDILGHGRLYLHTLLFLLVLACLGVLAMHLYRSNVLALVTGLTGLHQVMDFMWLTPVTWFYPFLGAFPTEAPVDLGGWLLALEAGSLSNGFSSGFSCLSSCPPGWVTVASRGAPSLS